MAHYLNVVLLIIDLHTHTYPKSDDSFIDINELIVEARSRGLDGICLTEHDSFWSQDEITVISARHNFLVIPGVEINTDSGHVLVFGLDKYIFGMHRNHKGSIKHLPNLAPRL